MKTFPFLGAIAAAVVATSCDRKPLEPYHHTKKAVSSALNEKSQDLKPTYEVEVPFSLEQDLINLQKKFGNTEGRIGSFGGNESRTVVFFGDGRIEIWYDFNSYQGNDPRLKPIKIDTYSHKLDGNFGYSSSKISVTGKQHYTDAEQAVLTEQKDIPSVIATSPHFHGSRFTSKILGNFDKAK